VNTKYERSKEKSFQSIPYTSGGQSNGLSNRSPLWSKSVNPTVQLSPEYGIDPREYISHRVIPNAHTSDLIENSIADKLSGAM